MTTKPPTPPRKAASPKVQALRPAPVTIEPPEGWELKSPFGFMAFDAGPASRLVRLAEILRWLEQIRSLPRKAALEVLCEAMPADVMTWLYSLRPNDYAQPVPEGSTFGFNTAAQIEAAKAKHRQELLQQDFENERASRYGGGWSVSGGRVRTTWPEPTEPGRPALLKLIRCTWVHAKRNRAATCDVLDDPRSSLTALAIPLDKAHAAWGYGRTVASTATPAAQEKGKKWTDERLRQLLADHQELKGKTVEHRKALVAKWGESEANIKKQLTRAQNLAATAASPFAGLGSKDSR